MGVFIAANSICVRLIRLLLKGKFQAFYKYAKTFNSDDFDYTALENGDYIFMRWKVGTSCFFYYSFSFRIKRSTSALVALSGAVSSSWPHDQRHQRCFLCGLLLHLLPEVHSHHWGLLLPQKLRVVSVVPVKEKALDWVISVAFLTNLLLCSLPFLSAGTNLLV